MHVRMVACYTGMTTLIWTTASFVEKLGTSRLGSEILTAIRPHMQFLEPRNVRLDLCTNGFVPHGQYWHTYSCWPVILTPYNLPPRMCMSYEYMFLTMKLEEVPVQEPLRESSSFHFLSGERHLQCSGIESLEEKRSKLLETSNRTHGQLVESLLGCFGDGGYKDATLDPIQVPVAAEGGAGTRTHSSASSSRASTSDEVALWAGISATTCSRIAVGFIHWMAPNNVGDKSSEEVSEDMLRRGVSTGPLQGVLVLVPEGLEQTLH
ncbi:UNVERIFIED_CONTAM: hypothetical protein Scaly_3146500 [Sesamum calycinum]|uniref:Uncharacterized protein n=1 Tax=Sesamum calycinum TaxID=2727403 RepID=A0AAW2JFL8_9LAMI